MFQHWVTLNLNIFPLRISISGLNNCCIYNIPCKKSLVFVINGVLEVEGNKIYCCYAKKKKFLINTENGKKKCLVYWLICNMWTTNSLLCLTREKNQMLWKCCEYLIILIRKYFEAINFTSLAHGDKLIHRQGNCTIKIKLYSVHKSKTIVRIT